MEVLAVILAAVLAWAWFSPERAGQWAARAAKAYRAAMDGSGD